MNQEATRVNAVRHCLQCLCLMLGASLAASAGAQTLFKSTDRDGHVTYADKPLPGTVKVEQFQITPVSPEDEARAAAERQRLQRQADAVRERERQRENALDQAHAEVLAALDALKQAQQRREAGVEPLPGERIGSRRGGSRLSESYFKRQRDLDQAVNDAQQRLERAYAKRNDLR